ncbi:unnamed protein product [Miscanthus lutarioriparius]|uniref:F-box associated beta-propeller type 3 domain-containing protein n=1 Tax=Miscanthus lutarioriparius TaxID=422564 RepID=A0A811RAD4_9POAL|nr:unnamed protein product [Miscanthus lutarioriparius]
MAEPELERGDAAAFIRNAPFDVHMSLVRRLSPKWIFRMRLSLDLRSGKLRAVFRFTENEGYGFDDNDLEGRDAPPIDDFRVDYKRMEVNYAEALVKPQLQVHASLDGYLLVSFLSAWYFINPATRHWVALPDLTRYDVVGFYEHVSSGEYRVLCFSGLWHAEYPAVYGVLTVSTVQLRFIGCPISPAAPDDHGLGLGVDRAVISPPIQFKRNLHLRWPPQQTQGYHILVFDTEKEEFNWKSPPPVRDREVSLLEFPTGDLGLSVSRKNRATLELWCLEDYQNEVWVLVHRIQLAIQQMPVLQDEDLWIPAVVSPEGDVLIESWHWLLHCDRNGNLLRKFRLPKRVFVRHVLRESLLQHRMFRTPKVDGAIDAPLFHWLCSDPSS